MLNPVACAHLIATHGERIRWFEALPCDCRDPGDPDFGDHRSCDKCQYGYVYREQPLTGDERAMVTQIRREILSADLGLLQVGDLVLTTMPDQIPVGNWDRIVLVQRTVPKKEVVRFGEDTLGEEFPVEVMAVTAGTTLYACDVDYRLDRATRRIVWQAGGSSPGQGVYAVQYVYNPVFWYVGSALKTGRPIPGRKMLMPQSGKLSLKHPLEG
ncbi:MAG: hypothetical protein AB7Y46_16790 [Armatimonadota bacterium]